MNRSAVKLTELLAPDSSRIYIEYGEEESDELRAVGLFSPITEVAERTEKYKETMLATIQGYSSLVVNAVRKGMASMPTPDKVTLEFGLQLGGEVGVPFVTRGTAEANVKVTIEWGMKKLQQG